MKYFLLRVVATLLLLVPLSYLAGVVVTATEPSNHTVSEVFIAGLLFTGAVVVVLAVGCAAVMTVCVLLCIALGTYNPFTDEDGWKFWR